MNLNFPDQKSQNDVLLCRVCLESFSEEDFLDMSITYDEDEGLTYSDCFSLCTLTNFEISNGLPCHLCRNCGLELQVAYDFQKKVREANRILEELFLAETKPPVNDVQNEEMINAPELSEKDEFYAQICVSEEETMDIKMALKDDEEAPASSCGEEPVESEQNNMPVESLDSLGDNDVKSPSLKRKKRSYRRRKPTQELSNYCDICNKKFADPNYLPRHRRIHDPERKTFQCPECERIFATNGGLKIHLRSHTGDGYLCPVCSKVFLIRWDLRVHMRFHTREFPYVCEVCGKKFAMRGSLNSHISAKHKNLRLSCKECGKLFQNERSLKLHSFIHSKMPFHCAYCVKGYPSKSKLKFHIKTKHKTDIGDEELEKMRQFWAERQKHTWVKVDTVEKNVS